MQLKLTAIAVLVSALLSGMAPLTAAQVQDTSRSSATTPTAALTADPSLLSQVERAHFIFRGVVTQVEYRLSDPSPEGAPQLPYTFVTYRIEELLKGATPAKSVTLRFLGGPRDNGKILQVEGTPFFDVGDQDILFVSKNGQSLCPLLGCESGRFRLINNQVFNDQGQPQSLAPTGELVSGKRVLLPEVLINQVGRHTVEYEISAGREEPPDDNASRAMPATPALSGLDPTQFTTHLRNAVQQLVQAGRLQSQPVVSADIQAPLRAPLANAASPPPDAASGQPSVTERQEQDSERRWQPSDQPVQK